MARVTGIGGVFMRCPDPKATHAWYVKHLGLPLDGDGFVVFKWAEDPKVDGGNTIWSTFDPSTEYFGESGQPFMFCFRVDDVDGMVARLEEGGVEILPKREDSEYGRFAWFIDCDGRRVELWQPPVIPAKTGDDTD